MLKPKLLLVDDKQDIDLYYRELLVDESFEVTVAKSTPDALQYLIKNQPDLVIADIAKVSERDRLSAAVKQKALLSIWVSKFDGLELHEITHMTRLINKPFKHIDLRVAIKSEFSKARRRFDTI